MGGGALPTTKLYIGLQNVVAVLEVEVRSEAALTWAHMFGRQSRDEKMTLLTRSPHYRTLQFR